MANMRTIMSDARAGMVFFGCLGPVIGMLAVALFIFVAYVIMAFAEGFDVLGIFMMPSALIPMALIAYYIAGVPALATGLVAGLMRRRLRHLGHCLIIGVVGAGLCVAWGLWFLAEDKTTVCLLGGLGCLSSTICAWYFRPQALSLASAPTA